MTQQTIERMAKESGLANFIEPENPAVQRFIQAERADAVEWMRKNYRHYITLDALFCAMKNRGQA